MTRIEGISGDTLARLLRKPQFLAGLDKAIDITRRTGHETSSDWFKSFGKSRYKPDDEIMIGDEGKVGVLVAEDRLEKQYQEQTGKSPLDGRGGWSDEFVEYLQGMDEVGEGLDVAYPGMERLREQGGEGLHKFNSEIWYPLIHFHTHPGKSADPSKADFKSLRSLEANLTPNYDGLCESKVRPVGLVVAAEPSDNKGHSLTFFQGDYVSPDEKLLQAFFGRTTGVESQVVKGTYLPASQSYNFPSQRRGRSLALGTAMQPFAFQSEINEEAVRTFLKTEANKHEQYLQHIEDVKRLLG